MIVLALLQLLAERDEPIFVGPATSQPVTIGMVMAVCAGIASRACGRRLSRLPPARAALLD
jgi:hypothetical protein